MAKTLGQIAYEAGPQKCDQQPWEQLSPRARKEWEAIASAVMREAQRQAYESLGPIDPKDADFKGVRDSLRLLSPEPLDGDAALDRIAYRLRMLQNALALEVNAK